MPDEPAIETSEQEPRSARFEVPAGAGRVRRFRHGLWLPIAILRAIWASPEARRRYLRVVLPQIVVAASVTLLLVGGRGYTDDLDIRVNNGGLHIRVDDAHEAAGSTPVKIAASRIDGLLGSTLAFWSALIGALGVVEWIVIVVSRDYHDAISKMASELTRVPPEDTPERPSVRINARWLWKKLKRRIRGLLLLVAGVPALWPLYLMSDTLAGMVMSAWAAYWLVVFTVAKTEHAWSWEDAPAPWFVRWSERAAAGRWTRFWIWPWYARQLRKRGADLFSPAAHLERTPWEAVGLTTIRALTRLPIAYTLFRPLIPVAATHLVLGYSTSSSCSTGSRPNRACGSGRPGLLP